VWRSLRCQVSAPQPQSARERLRRSWYGFDELAKQAAKETENKLGLRMTAAHRAALDELVASGELALDVASLVQQAYEAAVYHVWRSNAPITCYLPAFVDYQPSSASVLVEQSEILEELARQGSVDPDTLAKARAALEHDMAFYALSDAQTPALYERLMQGQ